MYSAVQTLNVAQVARHLFLADPVDLAHEMHHEDVFGGDRGVRFEFEAPASVVVLHPDERFAAANDGSVERRHGRRRGGKWRVEIFHRRIIPSVRNV
jgi:hypothetical protein